MPSDLAMRKLSTILVRAVSVECQIAQVKIIHRCRQHNPGVGSIIQEFGNEWQEINFTSRVRRVSEKGF